MVPAALWVYLSSFSLYFSLMLGPWCTAFGAERLHAWNWPRVGGLSPKWNLTSHRRPAAIESPSEQGANVLAVSGVGLR